MSRIFGPVTQNGYVVRDVDEAMAQWISLGVGPFFVIPEVVFESFVCRGRQSDPRLKIALANSGDLQIELIEQTNDAPSFYKDFIEDRGPGLHHLSVWTETFDADMARYGALGFEPFVNGALPPRLGFAFFEGVTHNGAIMEVFELTRDVKARFAAIREAAENWDGSDPIRFRIG
jgi:hypothetical protein